jgi:hypothetical protein
VVNLIGGLIATLRTSWVVPQNLLTRSIRHVAISSPAERRNLITGSRYVFCGKAARLPVQVQLPVSVRPQGPLRIQRVRVIFLLDLLEHHLGAIWGPLQAVRCG